MPTTNRVVYCAKCGEECENKYDAALHCDVLLPGEDVDDQFRRLFADEIEQSVVEHVNEKEAAEAAALVAVRELLTVGARLIFKSRDWQASGWYNKHDHIVLNPHGEKYLICYVAQDEHLAHPHLSGMMISWVAKLYATDEIVIQQHDESNGPWALPKNCEYLYEARKREATRKGFEIPEGMSWSELSKLAASAGATNE